MDDYAMSRRLLLPAWLLAQVLLIPAIAQVAVADVGTEDRSRTKMAEPPAQVQDFSLTAHDGRTIRLSEAGKGAKLVFFGFTNCPNVCPAAMQKLRQVYRALEKEKGELTCVLVSVDGARDTPEVMADFLDPFQPGFVGLTGDPKLVRPIADGLSAVFFRGMPTDRAGGYNVEHTSQVYLVDRGGRLRATFYDAPAEEMVRVVREVMAE